MKDGTIDIPAIKFKVVSGGIRENNDGTIYFDQNCKNRHIYDFDSIDGLTLKQFFRVFNCNKHVMSGETILNLELAF